ncbi:MAG: VWA domain-containing protein [Lachnospiraceae bacterium]|nr:VWA domain-containing protein [Lachnospiraceae bacterium]
MAAGTIINGKRNAMIVFIIDKSGSMSGFEFALSHSFTTLMSKIPKEFPILIILFDSNISKSAWQTPLETARNFNYQIGDYTALYDAIYEAISEVNKKKDQKTTATGFDYAKSDVLYFIITDGYENASKKFPPPDGLTRIAAQIRTEIKKGEIKKDGIKRGKRHFFLIADFCIDHIEVAKSLGIHSQYCQLFPRDADGIRMVFEGFAYQGIDCYCKNTLHNWQEKTRATTYKGEEWGNIVDEFEFARDDLIAISETLHKLEKAKDIKTFFENYNTANIMIGKFEINSGGFIPDYACFFKDELNRLKHMAISEQLNVLGESFTKGISKMTAEIKKNIKKIPESAYNGCPYINHFHTEFDIHEGTLKVIEAECGESLIEPYRIAKYMPILHQTLMLGITLRINKLFQIENIDWQDTAGFEKKLKLTSFSDSEIKTKTSEIYRVASKLQFICNKHNKARTNPQNKARRKETVYLDIKELEDWITILKKYAS